MQTLGHLIHLGLGGRKYARLSSAAMSLVNILSEQTRKEKAYRGEKVPIFIFSNSFSSIHLPTIYEKRKMDTGEKSEVIWYVPLSLE